MKKLLPGIALILAAVLLLAFLPGYTQDNQQPSKVCFRQDCFTVETALAPEKQAQGLMFRQDLDPDKGMLFVFPEEGIHPFWMKNTLIPLDMIWMDSNRTAVFIKKDAEPCGSGDCPVINPGVPARYVLEVNAGISEKIGLEEGGKMEFYLE